MTSGNQQDHVDEGGVRSFGIIRIKKRGIEGDGVNDETPLVLKRKPYVESGVRGIVSAECDNGRRPARGTYNWLLSSSVITSASWVRLGAGLSQLKLVSSGEGEGEDGLTPVEYTEGDDEDAHSEYCCSVKASDGSSTGLETTPQVGGCNGEVVVGGVRHEDEVDAVVSELLRSRLLDSKSRRRASRRDILPSSICFLLLGFLSAYLHSSRFDRAQVVQTGFMPSHFWIRVQ